jgi:polysaccharide biosynthesis transport protein
MSTQIGQQQDGLVWQQKPRRLHTLRRALRRRWRWVVGCCAVAGAVGAVIAWRQQPLYQAQARMRIFVDRPITTLVENNRPITEEATAVRSQFHVIRSTRILAPVAEKLDLPSRWNTDLAGAVSLLKGTLSPKRFVDANVTELRVEHADPQLAADIANAVAQSYLAQANQPRYAQTRDMLDRLGKECDEQAARLRQAEADVQALRQDVGLISTPLTQAADALALGSIRKTIAEAEADAIEAQLRADTTRGMRDADLVMALQAIAPSDNLAQGAINKLLDAEQRLAQAEAKYGPAHPRIAALWREFDVAQSGAATQIDRAIRRIQNDGAAADLRASEARKRLTAEEGLLTATAGRYGDLVAATQREDLQRRLFNQLTERAQKLAIDMQFIGPAGEMIEPASVPTVVSSPTALQIICMVMCAGLAMGMLSAMLVDRLDSSIREPDEIATQLDLPMLGAIGRDTVAELSASSSDIEAYRMIRNSIDFADHTIRTLCVTAARAGEGASTTAANLARTWAEHGARVLVVDTDLTDPSVHRFFNISNEHGLLDFLTTGRPLEQLVQSTSLPNVSIIAAGGPASASLQMLPQQLTELVIWSKAHADIILFNTSPILENSDTVLIARHAENSIFVARERHASSRSLRRAVHMLQSSGTSLLGVVLTDASVSLWDPAPPEMLPLGVGEEQTATSVRRAAVASQRKRPNVAA